MHTLAGVQVALALLLLAPWLWGWMMRNHCTRIAAKVTHRAVRRKVWVTTIMPERARPESA